MTLLRATLLWLVEDGPTDGRPMTEWVSEAKAASCFCFARFVTILTMRSRKKRWRRKKGKATRTKKCSWPKPEITKKINEGHLIIYVFSHKEGREKKHYLPDGGGSRFNKSSLVGRWLIRFPLEWVRLDDLWIRSKKKSFPNRLIDRSDYLKEIAAIYL